MPSFLSGCFLCVCYLAVCAGQEPGTVQDLAAGHPVSVLLNPGHVAAFRLDIEGAEAEEIFLDAGVPDISYRIIANDGTESSIRIRRHFWLDSHSFCYPEFRRRAPRNPNPVKSRKRG